MRNAFVVRFLFACALFIAAGTSSIRPASAAHTPALLYASAIESVNVYSQDPSFELPIAQLTAASGVPTPAGLAVDSHGNVWVANQGDANGNNYAILEYPPGSPKPSFVIHEPDTEAPIYVAVAPDGTVYVVNYLGSGVYSLAAFAAGKRTPFEEFDGLGTIGGIAVDSHNDLYVAHEAGSPVSGRVERFKPRHSAGVDLGISLTSTGGVAIDPSGNIVALDPNARNVNVYAPGKSQPARTIRVNSLLFLTTSIALDDDGSRLYVAFGGGFCCGQSGIYVYDYASGKQIRTIFAGFPASFPPSGLAVSPSR